MTDENEPLLQNNESLLSGVERRIVRRKKINVKKMILANLSTGAGEEKKTQYLYMNDVSEGGMQFISDIYLPEGTQLKMEIYLDHPINLEARVIWNSEVGSGNYITGVAFPEEQGEMESGVLRLLQWAEPYAEKRSHRVNNTLYFQTDFEEPSRNFYAHIVVISPGGMEVMNNFAFPEGRELSLRFSLRHDIPLVSVKARVLFQKVIPVTCDTELLPNNHKIWLEFLEPDPVKAHIRSALLEKKTVKPRKIIDTFELDQIES